MGIVFAVLLFSFIVIVHELGHFLLAKKNGIEVSEFALGMGPRLLQFERGGTVYCLKLLPFGGSCMMGEDETDNLSEGSFNSKSVWARISVIVAGPVFNFLLAFVFSVILVAQIGYDAAVVAEVNPGFAAEEAGMRAGDVIVKMNDRRIHLWKEVRVYNQFHQGEPVRVTYEREGVRREALLEPKLDKESGRYLLGVNGGAMSEDGGILKSIQYGAYELRYWIYTTLESLKMLVSGGVRMEDISGPVGIVTMVDETYEMARPSGMRVVLLNLLNIGILLSANLGVMNLLPVPALDGGRLVFLLVEAVRGKRIPPEKEGMIHLAGFAVLFALMIVVLMSDVRKIFL